MLLPKGLFMLFPAVVARAGFLTWSPPSKLIDFLFRLLEAAPPPPPDNVDLAIACNPGNQVSKKRSDLTEKIQLFRNWLKFFGYLSKK